MTKKEAAIISAFTGITCCDFGLVHQYIEKIMERPVWTHELADKKMWEEIREKSREDFLNIVENLTD